MCVNKSQGVEEEQCACNRRCGVGVVVVPDWLLELFGGVSAMEQEVLAAVT